MVSDPYLNAALLAERNLGKQEGLLVVLRHVVALHARPRDLHESELLCRLATWIGAQTDRVAAGLPAEGDPACDPREGNA